MAVALGVSQLIDGVSASAPSLIGGVATLVIDVVPKPVKDFAISTFGTYDKAVLGVGIVVVALGLGGMLRRRWAAPIFAGFGILAGLAAARSPQVGLTPALLTGAVAATAGWGAWRWLAGRSWETETDRRRFLVQTGRLIGLAAVMAAGGRYFAERSRVILAGREEVVLPAAAETALPVGSGASLDVPGLTPVVVPNDRFYRIDTAPFNPPRVDLATWTLRVTGMVDRALVLGFDDLLEMPLIERYVTLSCVSNEIGGALVGNALWRGVPLADLLLRAGVRQEASQVVGRSIDDFTVGFPVEAVFDGREALVAVGMNGEPLPFDHGFPARLVVAGLFGYVSATKWLSEIELTTWDGFDAYWIPRGWAKKAPIKTQSRIDTPRGFSRLEAGPVTVAGVAWAPNLGIERVEVRFDGGEWVETELSQPLSKDSWVQWKTVWEAEPGDHVISVRATDSSGYTQTAQVVPPAPDGATGHHTIEVDVV